MDPHWIELAWKESFPTSILKPNSRQCTASLLIEPAIKRATSKKTMSFDFRWLRERIVLAHRMHCILSRNAWYMYLLNIPWTTTHFTLQDGRWTSSYKRMKQIRLSDIPLSKDLNVPYFRRRTFPLEVCRWPWRPVWNKVFAVLRFHFVICTAGGIKLKLS